MIELSPLVATLILGGGLLIAVLLGFPMFLSLGGVALIVGLATYGEGIPRLFYGSIMDTLSERVLLAVPLFVFMGVTIENSGIAEKLFNALHLWLGGIRGGLVIVTILVGTILATTVGIIAASVTMLGLIALPAMAKRGYSRELACGAVCAGATLGVLIPPSILLVVYGPNAQISVGRLFIAALLPGLLLASLYIAYIAINTKVNPENCPVIPQEERQVPLLKVFSLLFTSILPPVILILTVLGSIFFGIASPTEAAAIGALAAIFLSAGYRKLNWKMLGSAVMETIKITGLVAGISLGASMFMSMFFNLGCDGVITETIISAPGGRWGIFLFIMFILFFLGMFIDWLGIVFVVIPVISPIVPLLGFNELWFAMMIIVNLQMSFLTPPFCPTLFVLHGIIKPEWGITSAHMINGVLPFVLMILIGLGLCVAFPEIILWLPSLMIK